MKKKLVVLVVSEMVMLGGMLPQLKASDFAPIDLKAPQTSMGTFFEGSGESSSAGGLVALVTLKNTNLDNTVLGSISRSWVPLTIGGTMGRGLGGPSIAMGTGMNLLPVAQATLYSLLNALSSPGQLNGLKVALAASPTAASLFVGPQESLIFRSPSKMQTKLTWFAGVSITWK